MSKKTKSKIIFTLISIIIVLIATYFQNDINKIYNKIMGVEIASYNIDNIPEYSGKDFVVLNDNVPDFNENDFKTDAFEKYSNLDLLGRCGVAFANLERNMMPLEKRGPIGMIKPSGWQIKRYDFIEGEYVYNRCHLIGYQLTGQNANEKNLITCTRQMNSIGMLKFENKVAEYIKRTNNHVLYRVSPIFKDKDLLAQGVQMEARSIEDNGKGIMFNVFIYNVQDRIVIDYSTGENHLKNDKD